MRDLLASATAPSVSKAWLKQALVDARCHSRHLHGCEGADTMRSLICRRSMRVPRLHSHASRVRLIGRPRRQAGEQKMRPAGESRTRECGTLIIDLVGRINLSYDLADVLHITPK